MSAILLRRWGECRGSDRFMIAIQRWRFNGKPWLEDEGGERAFQAPLLGVTTDMPCKTVSGARGPRCCRELHGLSSFLPPARAFIGAARALSMYLCIPIASSRSGGRNVSASRVQLTRMARASIDRHIIVERHFVLSCRSWRVTRRLWRAKIYYRQAQACVSRN